ncbi:MAG TPA: RidA family protein [Actinomycetota bacterium]|nr:RidA family protein [Actinomycetota bacterium]
MTTPHELVNPDDLLSPAGFSHAVVATSGRVVHIAGQTAHGPDGALRGETVAEQFEQAVANLARVLDAVDGRPEHLVSMQIFVTDVEAYRSSLQPIGAAWRRHLGKHYPAVSLFEVKGLFDPAATVEIVAVAVVPA